MQLQNSSQDYIIRQLNIVDILKKPEQYERAIKIIIQTLINLGDQESAKVLEEESKIEYFDKNLEILKCKLEQQQLNFIEIEQLFESILKHSDQNQKIQIKLAMLELELNQMFRAKTLDDNQLEYNTQIMIRKIQDFSDQIQSHQSIQLPFQQLIQKFIFNEQNQNVKSRLVERIIDKCEKSGVEKHAMEKIIKFYIEKRFIDSARGLEQNDLTEFSLINHEQVFSHAPQKRIYKTNNSSKYEISLIKFNKAQSHLVTIGSNKTFPDIQSEIILWDISNIQIGNRNINSYIDQIKHRIFLKGKIIAVAWDHSQIQSKFVVVLKNQIIVFNQQLKQVLLRNISGVLCCQYNPINSLLYACGLSGYIHIFNDQNEDYDCVKAIKARQLMFNKSGTMMYLSSAIQHKIEKWSTFQLQQQANILFGNHILDLQTIEDRNIILVTTKDQIYLIDQITLEILKTLEIQQYNEVKLVNFSTKYVRPWIVNFNKNVINAWNLNDFNYKSKFHDRLECSTDVMYSPFDIAYRTDKYKIASANKKRVEFWDYGLDELLIEEMESSGTEIEIQQSDCEGEYEDQWIVGEQQQQN